MATYTWTGASNKQWGTAGNWSITGGGTGVPVAGSDVVIDESPSAAYTITLNANSADLNSLTITDAGTSALTLAVAAGNTLTVGLGGIALSDTSTGAAKITVGAGSGVTTTGSISLSSGTSITGQGTLATTGGISGSGTVDANGGTLTVMGPVASGVVLSINTAANSNLDIAGTATFTTAISITNANQTLTVSTGGNLTIDATQDVYKGSIALQGGTLSDSLGFTLGHTTSAGAITGYGTLNGAVTTAGTVTNTITATGGQLEVVSGVSVGWTGALALAIGGSGGAGTLTLDVASSATSATFDSGGGTLELGGNLALASGLALGAGDTLQLDGGAKLNDAAGVTLSGGTIEGAGSFAAGTALSGNGTVTASGGTLTFNTAVDQSGAATSFTIANGQTLAFDDKVGTGVIDPTVAFSGAAGTLNLIGEGRGTTDFQGTVNVNSGNTGDQILVAGAIGDTLSLVGGDELTVTNSSSQVVDQIEETGFTSLAGIEFTAGTTDTITICVYPGTLIRTPDGEVAVETLKRGDLVVTKDGIAKPVEWLGRQTISTRFADPLRAWPIRVKAAAIGENAPSRDLVLSPGHALLVDGALILASALVNGGSIVRETRVPEVFTYYHIELDDHSLVMAENTPAETFVDNVDRLAFDNWDEHLALFPNGKSIVELPYPVAKSHRQVPINIGVKLAERAQAIGAAATVAA